jgi:excisionase family DNA binding protein
MKNLKSKRGRPKNPINEPFKNEYMSVSDVADMLKLSVSHIYTLTSTKKIPHIKLLGKKILFKREDIQNWLDSKIVSVSK